MILTIFVFLIICALIARHIITRNEEIYIYPDFLHIQSFKQILSEMSLLQPEDETHSYAIGRKVVYLDPNLDPNTYTIMRAAVSDLKKYKLTDDIEYRVYPNGSHMDWHRDTNLGIFSPQYECILTLENTSDSIFQYKKDNQIHSLHTKPNTLIIVRGNGIEHRVTPVTQGHRSILKFICK